MKTFSVSVIVVSLLACVSSAYAAKPIFFSFGGETIAKIADFPDTPEFQNQEGHYVDAGMRYKQISIFFIPVWNYDQEWCGYISDKMYLDLSKEKLDELATAAHISLPSEFQVSFWDKIGGKLLLGALLIAYFLYLKTQPKDVKAS
jgi:hypothetical protein